MNKIQYLILVIIISLISCDGRDRIHKTSQEVLKENKLLDSFSEKTVYIPESYNEVITDTILSNGFNIHINTQIDMEHSILKEDKEDNISNKRFYRDSVSVVTVTKNGKILFLNKVDKSFIQQNDNINIGFLKTATLLGVWLNDSGFDESDAIHFDIVYGQPDTKHYKIFTIAVDDKGRYSIKNKKNFS